VGVVELAVELSRLSISEVGNYAFGHAVLHNLYESYKMPSFFSTSWLPKTIHEREREREREKERERERKRERERACSTVHGEGEEQGMVC
jgi:hypothetical protein